MNCPAAPKLEARMPDNATPYALEGTLAHAYCSMKLKEFLNLDTLAEYEEILQLKDEYHTGEMDEYTDTYATIVMEKYNAARKQTRDARLLVETRLDFSAYVPDSFGTSDATIIADGCMEIIDFKYGKGVKVSAIDNPQMMIYALGAYTAHSDEYRIDRVRMTIVQPRIDNLSEFEMPVDELLRWAETRLKPAAREAYRDDAGQTPGEWCQFCKVKSSCRALAEKCMGVAKDSPDPRLIPADVMAAEILPWLSTIKTWCSGVEDYALERALAGERYPGYKLVEGRSVRKITDPEAMALLLRQEGYADSEFMKPASLCGLTDLEKLVGKKHLAAIGADYITKPQGKPTLVPEGDKRPALNTAVSDFDGID